MDQADDFAAVVDDLLTDTETHRIVSDRHDEPVRRYELPILDEDARQNREIVNHAGCAIVQIASLADEYAGIESYLQDFPSVPRCAVQGEWFQHLTRPF